MQKYRKDIALKSVQAVYQSIIYHLFKSPESLIYEKKKKPIEHYLEVVRFRRWSGINSRAGKSGVAIAASSLWLKLYGTVKSQVKVMNLDDGSSFLFQ